MCTINPMGDGCHYPGLLERHGVRCTAIRLALLEVLGGAERALCADEILQRIRRSRKVNRVTIYRILEDFSRRGILRKVLSEGRALRFELACEHHPPHPHFECSVCGEFQCLDPVPLERVWVELKGPVGNRVDRIEIRVQGVCRRCRGLS